MDRRWTRGDELRCLRCDQALEFLGTRDFHEGTRWGALGEVAELFVNKDRYDAMICRNCTHVELFLGGGIAERPEE